MAKTIIVVNLTEQSFSALEIEWRNNHTALLRYALRKIPENGVSPSWLRTVFSQEYFSHNKIIVVLPSDLVKFKSVIVPSLAIDQLESAIKLELSGVNGSQDEIYKIISFQKQEQMLLVKVAVINDLKLTEFLKFFEDAGFEVQWSGLRTRGIQNFINFNSGFLDDQLDGVMYLDLAEDETEFGVINEESLVYRRSFSPGANQLIEQGFDGEYQDFLEEVRLSIASFKSVVGSQLPEKVWIFGRSDLAFKLQHLLPETLHLKTYIPDRTRLAGVITQKYTPELAPLIGLALDQTNWFRKEEAIPIYSSVQEMARVKKEQANFWGSIAFIVLLTLSGIFLGVNSHVEQEKKIAQWLSRHAHKLSILKKTEQTTLANLKKIDMIETWLDDQHTELEFLLTLQTNLPEGTMITDLTLEKGIVKDISGITPSVSKLLQDIRKDPILKSLKLKGNINITDGGELFHLEGRIGKEAGQ